MFKSISEFIRSLYPNSEIIPLHSPTFNGNEKKYINECIDSTFVSSVGKFVDKFENITAEYTGSQGAVVCVNGTSALHLALLLVGVKEGDEVITQALTFIATCNAINYIGACPIFIDVDKETMGLSPTAVERWLIENSIIKNSECYNKKTGKRIKACVPMHTFGHPTKLIEIVEVCRKFNIELVEDAAESIGSLYYGKHTGTFGKIGIISYNGNKTITTGGGGMLLFQDEKLARIAKHMSTQAKLPHKWEFVHDQIGYNYRMPNINAAIGCAQMEQIDIIIANKRALAKKYEDFFNKFDEIEFVREPQNCNSNYWLNSIILKDSIMRDNFLEYTNSIGIMTRPIWKLMSQLPMYKNSQTDLLENSHFFASTVVNIPSSVTMN